MKTKGKNVFLYIILALLYLLMVYLSMAVASMIQYIRSSGLLNGMLSKTLQAFLLNPSWVWVYRSGLNIFLLRFLPGNDIISFAAGPEGFFTW